MKMTFKTIVIGGILVFIAVVTAVVFIPALVFIPQQTFVAQEYTGVVEKGRVLFYSNGCNYCHTQYVRPQDTGMGGVSYAGNYVYDNPLILGSERTGPDLSYVGRKRSEGWEIEHLKEPREFSPMSIMPSFNFLSQEELVAISAYVFQLGDRVSAQRMIRPPDPYVYAADPVTCPLVEPLNDTAQGWPDWLSANLQQGKEIYTARCLTCHGCSGNGLGTYAGTLVVTPADYKQNPFNMMPEDEFFWHVSEGVQGSVMPPWKESLNEDERWSVVRYIISIFARPVMHDPDEGDVPAPYDGQTNPLTNTLDVLDQGKQIFTRECMVCHGDSGRGDGQYREVIQPGPPDFGQLADYADFTDADYFWRISEGVPWTAMPSWKVLYSENARWQIVHYIRSIFTQTETKPPAPPEEQEFTFPDFYRDSMRFPEDVSADRGQVIYLRNCANCHGLAGDGGGAAGQYLDPKPADYREHITETLTAETEGEYIARTSFGVKDSAMPVWAEWLLMDQRWDVVKYIFQFFFTGQPVTTSQYGDGKVPANYATISSQMFTDEGHVISPTHGVDIYAAYCQTCHGDLGAGNGPGTIDSASQSPAAFAAGMNEQYIFWRVWEGVPKSTMYAFKWALSSEDAWDVTTYIESFNSPSSGGQ